MKKDKMHCPICSSVIDIYTTSDCSTWLLSKNACSATAYCDCCNWNYREKKTFYGRTVRKAVNELLSYVGDIRTSRQCGMCKKFILDEGSDLYGKCSYEDGVFYSNLLQTEDEILINHYKPNNIYSWVNCYFFERKDPSTAICDEYGYG